jgi:hypothetical protein
LKPPRLAGITTSWCLCAHLSCDWSFQEYYCI